MNRHLTPLIAAAALTLTTGAAWAQSTSDANPSGPRTRAAVLAELAAARANGEMNPFDNLAYVTPKQSPAATYRAPTPVASAQGSGLTREEVRAELEAARRSGEINPFDNLAYVTPKQTPAAVPAPAAEHMARSTK